MACATTGGLSLLGTRNVNTVRLNRARACSVNMVRKNAVLNVSCMAKRNIELEEFRNMSDDSILDTVVDLKGELFLMRCKKVTRQDYRVSDYKNMKKKIARMLTVYREREIERGIKPRESRKLKRAWRRSIVYRPPPSLAATLDADKNDEKK